VKGVGFNEEEEEEGKEKQKEEGRKYCD